ncbi:MAG: ABC transporter ATP-binding protein [Cyanobacteria bacterium P01_E01_bin.6]
MSDTIIQVENLGKKYIIGHQQQREHYTSLRDVLTNQAKGIAQFIRNPKSKVQSPKSEEFWALKDVSFEVKRGDRIGIIGRNGAGKSTLLKILSRITEPTAGRVHLKGRVASLLEVGTGFHPELTGRENIFLNGAILGMSKQEISHKFDEIVAFAEVEKFLNTPVKRYSSGMYVRLAFAVAAHLEPEILVIDEVLAVGDSVFQKKCLGKMEDVAEQEGRTVLFVSHNMGMIQSLCNRCIYLHQGRILEQGISQKIIQNYSNHNIHLQDQNGEVSWSIEKSPGNEDIKLRNVRLIDSNGFSKDIFDISESITIEIVYEVLRSLRGARFVLQILTPEGIVAFASTNHLQQEEILQEGKYKTLCSIPKNIFNKNKYIVRINAGIPGIKTLIFGKEILSFSMTGLGNHGSYFPESWPGIVAPKLKWKTIEIISEGVISNKN